MSRTFVRAAALVAALAPAAALAGEKFDIPWFVAHPTERAAALKMCHDDYRYAKTMICANVEAAATRVWGRAAAPNTNPLTTTRYWVENPIGRKSELKSCALRRPGDSIALPYCSVAQLADRLAAR